jgi:FixJ family two-component response regulator
MIPIKVIILTLMIFIFVLSLAIDKINTRKLTELRNELEKDVESEQLTERERDILKKVILWSRIKVIASILLFIGFILYIFY